jgi:hypothetical protein
MQTDQIRSGEQISKKHRLSTHTSDIAILQNWVMGPYRHAQRPKPRGGLACSTPEADQSGPFAGDLSADRTVTRPFTTGDRFAGPECWAQQRHRSRNNIFRYSVIIRSGRWIHGNIASPTGVEIDIVETDAEPTHAFQLGRCLQQACIHPRAVTHDQGTRFAQSAP